MLTTLDEETSSGLKAGFVSLFSLVHFLPLSLLWLWGHGQVLKGKAKPWSPSQATYSLLLLSHDPNQSRYPTTVSFVRCVIGFLSTGPHQGIHLTQVFCTPAGQIFTSFTLSHHPLIMVTCSYSSLSTLGSPWPSQQLSGAKSFQCDKNMPPSLFC